MYLDIPYSIKRHPGGFFNSKIDVFIEYGIYFSSRFAANSIPMYISLSSEVNKK